MNVTVMGFTHSFHAVQINTFQADQIEDMGEKYLALHVTIQ